MCAIDWSVVGSLLVALLTYGLLVWIFLRTQKRNAEMVDENHRRTVELMQEQSEMERNPPLLLQKSRLR